jgi:hypothetical protein
MADLVNCCNGNAAGDLTQQIVTAIDDITANAEKICKFTNGGVTETVNLGGIPTNTLRKLVYDATNNLNGYVTQAANSAAQAASSKNAAAVSATNAAASAASADKNADICQLSATSAAVSASGASISAAKAKFYADKLEGIDAIIAAYGLAIALNAQGISDLSWTPWGVAVTACRNAQSAVAQAISLYRANVENSEARASIAWAAAITAVRQSVSAIRQAVEIAKLYRLVAILFI